MHGQFLDYCGNLHISYASYCLQLGLNSRSISLHNYVVPNSIADAFSSAVVAICYAYVTVSNAFYTCSVNGVVTTETWQRISSMHICIFSLGVHLVSPSATLLYWVLANCTPYGVYHGVGDTNLARNGDVVPTGNNYISSGDGGGKTYVDI